MASPWTRARRSLRQAAAADDLAGIMKQGIGGVFLTIGLALTAGINAVADVVIKPLVSLADGVATTVGAIFGEPGRIIGAAGQATAESLLGQFNVGPLTFALGIGAVLLGLWLVVAFLSEEETTNVGLFGTGIDIPTPGFGDAEEDDEG